MQRVILTIPFPNAEAGQRFSVVGNADGAGRPMVSLNEAIPVTGPGSQLVVPGGGSAGASYVREVTTPPLYFGRYRFVVRVWDAQGNLSPDADREFTVFVNSGPNRPAVTMRHSSTVNGRPVFTFTPPAQLRSA
jgi:hypothetical protein